MWFDLVLLSFRLLQLQRSVLSPDSDIPDELLYGRAGYLYALLYVNKEMGPDTVDETTITKVTVLIFIYKQAVKLGIDKKIHYNTSIDKSADLLECVCVSAADALIH